MEKELGIMGKKYEKLMDKAYLAQIQKTCETQVNQIKKLEHDNAQLTKRTKQIERQLDKQVKVEKNSQPRMETELKNLRQKLAYTTKKYEVEYNKLIDLSSKRKEMKERETSLQQKETRIIIKAKKDLGIDFEDPQALAKKAVDEQLREHYDQLQKKLDILEGAIQSQSRKFK